MKGFRISYQLVELGPFPLYAVDPGSNTLVTANLETKVTVMQYEMISADCHIDLVWLPPDLFTDNASAALKDRMPYVKRRLITVDTEEEIERDLERIAGNLF